MSEQRTQRTPGVWAVVRKTTLLVIGGALTLLGVALLVLPGPGIPLVIAGLAVLSPEFPWARRQRDKMRDAGRALLDRTRSPSAGEDPDAQ